MDCPVSVCQLIQLTSEKSQVMVIETRILPCSTAASSKPYEWFTENKNQEFLALAYNAIISLSSEGETPGASKMPHGYNLKLSRNLRMLYKFKPFEHRQHLVIPEHPEVLSGLTPQAIFVSDEGRKVLPFLNQRTTGSAYRSCTILGRCMEAFVDCYSSNEAKGVLKVLKQLSPNNSFSSNIATYFQAPPTSSSSSSSSAPLLDNVCSLAEIPVNSALKARPRGKRKLTRGKLSNQAKRSKVESLPAKGKKVDDASLKKNAESASKQLSLKNWSTDSASSHTRSSLTAIKTPADAAANSDFVDLTEEVIDNFHDFASEGEEELPAQSSHSDASRTPPLRQKHKVPSSRATPPLTHQVGKSGDQSTPPCKPDDQPTPLLNQRNCRTVGSSTPKRTSGEIDKSLGTVVKQRIQPGPTDANLDILVTSVDSRNLRDTTDTRDHTDTRDMGEARDIADARSTAETRDMIDIIDTADTMDTIDSDQTPPLTPTRPVSTCSSLTVGGSLEDDVHYMKSAIMEDMEFDDFITPDTTVVESDDVVPQSCDLESKGVASEDCQVVRDSAEEGDGEERNKIGDTEELEDEGRTDEAGERREGAHTSQSSQTILAEESTGVEVVDLTNEAPESGDSGGSECSGYRSRSVLSSAEKRKKMNCLPRDVVFGAETVASLTPLQLKKWMFLSKPLVVDIFKRLVPSDRHEEYASGSARRIEALKYRVDTRMFTSKQVDVVTQFLLKVFCGRHMKFFSYVMSVLQPECLIRIIADVFGISFEEAEKMMMNYRGPSAGSDESENEEETKIPVIESSTDSDS